MSAYSICIMASVFSLLIPACKKHDEHLTAEEAIAIRVMEWLGDKQPIRGFTGPIFVAVGQSWHAADAPEVSRRVLERLPRAWNVLPMSQMDRISPNLGFVRTSQTHQRGVLLWYSVEASSRSDVAEVIAGWFSSGTASESWRLELRLENGRWRIVKAVLIGVS
jgi:hypothetical protein